MSACIHQMVLTLQFDKACPAKQAHAIMARLLEGATLETAMYEESVRNGNNAAPIGYTVAPLSRGVVRKVAEVTDFKEAAE